MRRVAAISLLACACLAAPGTSALAANPLKRTDARARLTSCHRALALTGRSLTVDASMRSLRQGDRMQMRFDLLQRLIGGKRFRRLPGPGLGAWNPATPGVDRYRFRKPIQNLPAGASYMVKVTFRWLDDRGVAFARTVRFTPACLQPDLRPDLRIVGFAGTRSLGGGQRAYRVIVRNAGRTASRDFTAILTIAGLPRPAVNLAGLSPGQRRLVELTGPRCESGQTIRVELDPGNQVDEASETNNSRSTTC